ncbi:MAG: fimbrillin family protein [Alistipes senegalensis]|nr:fimbrillin family protein [Alistipes senegalensis]
MGIIKQLAILSTVAALAAAAVSCHKDDEWPAPQKGQSRRIEVRIATPHDTRTALDENTLATRWVKGDRMALWAYGNGTAAFENVPFTLWYPRESPDEGLFTGMIDAMTAGTYDYYASYPLPETSDGTKVSYTIPAVQNGAWNPDLDIMLAATQGAELREEILNDVTLHFRHKVHALKITIPEGRNLLGRPVEKLRIEFPQPVAGRMTWDLTHPDAAPEMAATSNAITIDFAEPVDAGESFWVFLAPTDPTGGEVWFTATDGTEISWPLSTREFRDCAAGRITPVKLTINELRPQREFRLTVDPARLGENVLQIDSLVMPEGYEFPALAREHTTRTFEKIDDNLFSTRIFDDQGDAFVDGIEVGLSVGSENTEGVYGKRCRMNGISADGCTVEAPYLFFEDFSETASYDAYADEDGGTAYELTEAGLPGWTGSRWKVDQQSLEVRTYVGTSTSKLDFKSGRVDSPALAGIKAGRKVKVRIHYDIGATTNADKGIPDCIFGVSEQAGAVAGGHGATNYPERKIDEYTLDPNGSPTNMPTAKEHEADECSNATRLTWFGYYKKKDGWLVTITGKTFYYYIDNIRVTIVR